MAFGTRGRMPELGNLLDRVDVLKKQIQRGAEAEAELPTVEAKIRSFQGPEGKAILAEQKRKLLEKIANLESLSADMV